MEWEIVLSEWKTSNLSQAEFCRLRNLNYWKFRRELAKSPQPSLCRCKGGGYVSGGTSLGLRL